MLTHNDNYLIEYDLQNFRQFKLLKSVSLFKSIQAKS